MLPSPKIVINLPRTYVKKESVIKKERERDRERISERMIEINKATGKKSDSEKER